MHPGCPVHLSSTDVGEQCRMLRKLPVSGLKSEFSHLFQTGYRISVDPLEGSRHSLSSWH